MMKRIFSIIVIVTLGFYHVQAQHITSQQWHGSYTGILLHPGIKLEKKVNILVPDISIGIQGNNLELGQYLTETGSGAYYFDRKKIGFLDHKNLGVEVDNQVQTFGLGIKLKDFHLLVGHSIQSQMGIKFSTDLLEVGLKGNGDYINQTMSLGPDINVMSYNVFTLGAQKSWSKLTVGVNAKILVGLGSIITEQSKLDLTTRDFDINIDADYKVHSSNGYLQYNGLDSIDSAFDFNQIKAAFSGNNGFGIDIGASYNLNDRLSLSAGITDIGKITWDKEATTYASKGNFTYSGVDVLPLLKDKNVEYSVEDTILNLLNITEDGGDFSTSLKTNYLLSGSFKLSDKWSFHGLLSSNGGFSTRLNHLSVAAVRKLWIIDLGLNYSLGTNLDFDHLGASLKFNLGPIKLYGAMDNILSVVSPLKADGVKLRIGAGAQF